MWRYYMRGLEETRRPKDVIVQAQNQNGREMKWSRPQTVDPYHRGEYEPTKQITT